VRLKPSDILALNHIELIDEPLLAGRVYRGVSTDSRTVSPEDVFIALRGERFDGHNFLTKAVERGSRLLVVEKSWTDANSSFLRSLRVPKLIVEDSLQTLADLAASYRRRFTLPVIAVAGSNGKTTTKEMIARVLGAKYAVLSTEGNLNNHIGVPHMLFRLRENHDIAVLELGTNHFGEINHLCDIAGPTHGLITNIGSEHLEFFGNREGVARAEGELFDWLRSHRGAKAVAFVNNDDTRVRKLARGVTKRITYGIESTGVDVKGSLTTDEGGRGSTLRVRQKSRTPFDVRVPVPGHHNGLNALAASAVGLAMKVPASKVQEALAAVPPVDKRMEVLMMDGVTILNDTYNANPDSVLASLSVMADMAGRGKRIAVLADMLELGASAEKEHRKIGRALKKLKVEYLLTFGPLARRIHEEAAVPFKAHYEQKNILAEYLVELVEPDDIVLVKGSRGMKMEDVVLFLSERLSSAPQSGGWAA